MQVLFALFDVTDSPDTNATPRNRLKSMITVSVLFTYQNTTTSSRSLVEVLFVEFMFHHYFLIIA